MATIAIERLGAAMRHLLFSTAVVTATAIGLPAALQAADSDGQAATSVSGTAIGQDTLINALEEAGFTTGFAFAQQSQAMDQTQQSNQQSQGAVVATVGDAQIYHSDVMAAIGTLPPHLLAQPRHMLVPLAVEQLILRELILQEGRGQNLADDPDVIALVESSAPTATEDPMVQVWLNREMAKVVTDEAVQQAYMDAQAQGLQILPPINALRPQIEQHLRRQAMHDIHRRLRQGADIVLFDPSGRQVEQPQEGRTQRNQASPGDGDGTAGSNGSEGFVNGQSAETAAGSLEISGE